MNDTDSLVAYLVAQEWKVNVTGKHIKVTSPEGKMVTLPSTPSDHRSIKNSISELKRNGLMMPHKVRKPKRKEYPVLALDIADTYEIDLQISPFPHITEIIGAYRSPSWFVETPEGRMPLSEDDWPGPDEQMCTASVLLDHMANFQTVDGGLISAKKPGMNSKSLPSMRTRRVMLDSFRFWSAGEEKDAFEPKMCICGFSALEEGNGMYRLAEHIVIKHERADYTHCPCGDLWPWADPATLLQMFELDERDEEIKSLNGQITKLKDQRDTAWKKLEDVKRVLS